MIEHGMASCAPLAGSAEPISLAPDSMSGIVRIQDSRRIICEAHIGGGSLTGGKLGTGSGERSFSKSGRG